jgi:hypothetical protein
MDAQHHKIEEMTALRLDGLRGGIVKNTFQLTAGAGKVSQNRLIVGLRGF